jgi:hypothetical protein
MDLAKIKEILETESSVFKEAVQSAIDQAVDRRVQAKAQIAESLGLNQTGEMSEQDFFAVLDQYDQISNHLDAVLDQAGFSAKVRSAWLNKKDSPRPKFRRPTVQMLLEVVIDHYADNRLFHDIHGILEEWGHLETIDPSPKANRAELLSKRLEEFDSFGNLSVRARNAIKNDNILTVGELTSMYQAEMIRIPKFGRKSLNESIAFLKGLGLEHGELTDSEKKDVEIRRALNESAEKPLVTEWHGDIKAEYENANHEVRRQAGGDIYEVVKADPGLIKALKAAGITCRTELATAPQEILDEICEDNADWSEQLPFVLNGRNLAPQPYWDHGWNLELGTVAPLYLDKKVKVYKGM